MTGNMRKRNAMPGQEAHMRKRNAMRRTGKNMQENGMHGKRESIYQKREGGSHDREDRTAF